MMNRAELKCKFEAGKQAIRKAVDFQLGFLGEDGSYIWDGYVSDAYHKQAYSWNLVGNNEEAHRLLTWIRDTRLRPDGSLILTDDPNDTVNNVDLYKHSWTCQGAHRLGRFDVSYPIYQFIKTCERPCGGFPLQRAMPLCRAMTTGWVGVTALYFNDIELARRCADWCISVQEQQPDSNKYYFMTTDDGKLALEKDGGEFIDNTKLKQCYWEIGFSMILLGRMYQVTKDEKYLDSIKRWLDFLYTCREDVWQYWGSGKAALGAAMYYSFTGDERGIDAATQFIDFVVREQVKIADKDGKYAGGFWFDDEPDILLIYVDHAACFSGWVLDSISYIESRLGIL
ncbi:MAG: hypothetical protein ACOX1U_00630 [Saccharofermentanales bacterium]|jgi:hypothetical protein|nr:hypothetical protein [Clostridiaceae bacterium]